VWNYDGGIGQIKFDRSKRGAFHLTIKLEVGRDEETPLEV